jgi:hypothetical protein
MDTVELITAVGPAFTVVIIAIVGRRMQVVQPSPDAKPHRAAEQPTGTSFARASGGVVGQPSGIRSRSKSSLLRHPTACREEPRTA